LALIWENDAKNWIRYIFKNMWKIHIKMENSKIESAISYAESLVGLPFRWYDPEVDSFVGDDKFWCENSTAPSAGEIKANDKAIVCTGLPNLMRRFCGLRIPGLGHVMRGKYKEEYKKFPGGTCAWYAHLRQNKRLQKLNMNERYPKGTLLIARYKSNEKDQGHLAVVYDDVDETKNITHQRVIHSAPTIDYPDRADHENHGEVKIESFMIGNEMWKWDKISYYKYVCLPENWLVVD
jgi:hypothetical protein